MRILVLLLFLLKTVLSLPIIPVLEEQSLPMQSESTVSLSSESQESSPSTSEEEGLTVPPMRFIPVRVDATVDVNGDGVLDIDEVRYAAFVHHGLSAGVVEDMFKQVDINHDSVLDAREFDAIRLLVLEKAENAALRYLQNVDTDRDGLLSLQEAQTYLLKEYGIGYRDVHRLWKLVTPSMGDRLNSTLFSRLRRRVRGMTIRLARQIMKTADVNGDGHISVDEAQNVGFEQEGIGAGDVASMVGSVDENMDGELNAPEFADFERIVRARALENSKKAMRVVDADNSGTLTLDEAKRVAFEHYGFNEETLAPFFGQADENEDGQLDTVEFAGFRSVIRARSVKDAMEKMKRVDTDGDMLISSEEATDMTRKEDDMDGAETVALFNIADQNKSGKLDKVEFADFNRLVRLSSIKFATDHFKEFDLDGNDAVTFEEIALLIEQKYGIPQHIIKTFFNKIDVDNSDDLNPAEIVDFRHLIRDHVSRQRQDKNKSPSSSSSSSPTTTVDVDIVTSTVQNEVDHTPAPTLIHGDDSDIITTTPPTTTSTKASTTITVITTPITTTSTLSTTTTTLKKDVKEQEKEVLNGIGNDVIAQDIGAPVMTTTKRKLLKATREPVIETEPTTTPSATTEPITTTTSEPITTTTPASSTVSTTKSVVFTTVSKKITRKPKTFSTTVSPLPSSSESTETEVVIEEIVYEDENGNRMNPKKRKTGRNEDVSYEEVIEYVDEPATN